MRGKDGNEQKCEQDGRDEVKNENLKNISKSASTCSFPSNQTPILAMLPDMQLPASSTHVSLIGDRECGAGRGQVGPPCWESFPGASIAAQCTGYDWLIHWSLKQKVWGMWETAKLSKREADCWLIRN